MRSLTTIDYTRTCDVCHQYVSEEERLNEAQLRPNANADGQLSWLWYSQADPAFLVNHFCDTCYLCMRLEGRL